MADSTMRDFHDNTWGDFTLAVGKRLVGMVYLERPQGSPGGHVYFVYEDGTACELYTFYNRLCPKKNNWDNVNIEYFIDMARKSPRDCRALYARINPDTNEVVREHIECIGELRAEA